MTPKEKAEELFNKVNDLIPIESDIKDTVDESNKKICEDFLSTKNICLLICDEVNKKLSDLTILDHVKIGYWKMVKEEIKNI